MKHLFTVLSPMILLLSFTTTFAQYTFIGSGSWDNPANWQGGSVPSSGDNVTINGNCTLTVQGTFKNSGVLWIKNTGSLTIEASMPPFDQFTNEFGTVTIDGQLINKVFFANGGTFNANGSITNHATFQNGVPFTLKSGATFTNASTGLFASGQITMEQGSNFVNNGKLFGTFTLGGNGSVSNGGTLAPGNSPGTITFNGSYTATPSSIHNFEIGGTTAGSYDVLNVGGTATLGGAFNVSLINGFTPSAANPDLPLVTGTISGTFATVNKPSQYQLVYNANNVTLRYLSTLPMTFSNVGVKKDGSSAYVYWDIIAESNISHYEVEKSINATSFTKIGEVKAALINQYSFKDYSTDKSAYYRIKSIDKGGNHGYSVIVRYNEGRSSVELKVFPTVGNSSINIQHSTTAANSKIVIYAVDGRIIQTVFPPDGVQKTTIDVSNFIKGTYLIRYYREKQSETAKFIRE